MIRFLFKLLTVTGLVCGAGIALDVYVSQGAGRVMVICVALACLIIIAWEETAYNK